MKRIALAAAATVALYSCQDAQFPTPAIEGLPSLDISDAAHGNPEARFFFLPPIVEQPAGFTGPFNGGFLAAVEICNITEDPDCDGFVTRFEASDIEVDLDQEHYKVNWHTGDSNLDARNNYRIRVLVGSRELGFRDVDPADSPNEVPSNSETLSFYPFLNGSTIPLKWRIETGALCDPGVPPELCGEGVVDLAVGGTVQNQFGDGVEIPAQGGDPDLVTVIVQPCQPIQDLPVDIPVFGPCLDVRTDPALANPGLSIPAIVSVCSDLGISLSEEQETLVTLHRQDPNTGDIEALPHAPDACPAPGIASNGLAGLARAGYRAVRDRVVAWVAPRPLAAARRVRRLDIGRGGSTPIFSFFQMALPATGEIVPETNNQTALAGSTLPIAPTVHVKDGNGADVENATVHFEVTTPAGGNVDPIAVVTGPTGLAQVTSWTLASTPGVNTLRAFGVGIAGPNANGPLPGIDPFAPEQRPNPQDEVPVLVLTGEVVFTAVGCAAGFGTPQAIDGVMTPGEWDCAESVPFTANLSGGNSASAELFWMNDGTNLHLAVRVERGAEDKVNSLGVDFDNDADGIAELGDDVLIVDGDQPAGQQFSDNYLTDKCLNRGQSACGNPDVSAGGTQDGTGAFSNDGTYSVYELSHPLDSADDPHDYSLTTGNAVGFYVSLRLGKGAQGDTQFPDFRTYQVITVK